MPEERSPRAPLEGGKKQAIMNAALAVITEKGYHPATIDEIAEKAGVGKGTIYLYFESKLALVSELIDSVTRAHLNEMEKRIAQVQGAKEKLLVLADVEFDFWRRHAPLAQILASGEMVGMAHELRDQMRAARERYVRLIQSVIEEGQRQGVFAPSIDAALAAAIIFGARLSLFQFAAEHRGAQPDAIRGQALDFFLRALGAAPAREA